MRVVYDAIEDGVGVGGIADQLVPFVDGDLAGDDRRSSAVAFLENLEQVVTSCSIEGLEPPVVEDEQLHTADRSLDAGIATVTAGKREIGEELGNALVKDRAVVATGFVAERRGSAAASPDASISPKALAMPASPS